MIGELGISLHNFKEGGHGQRIHWDGGFGGFVIQKCNYSNNMP
jgi:hypothetical protein